VDIRALGRNEVPIGRGAPLPNSIWPAPPEVGDAMEGVADGDRGARVAGVPHRGGERASEVVTVTGVIPHLTSTQSVGRQREPAREAPQRRPRPCDVTRG